ncbi:MAG: anti-sigma factor [Bacteroidota bacterium]
MDIKTYISSGVLEQYILGLCSPEETQQVEEYAAKYPEVSEKIKKLQCCMEHYAELHAIPPPPRLKGKILSKIDDIAECQGLSVEFKKGVQEQIMPSAPPSTPFDWSRIWTGIAALMILSLSALSYSFYQKQNAANAELKRISSEINSIKFDYKELRDQSDQLQARYAVLKDVGTKHVHMTGSKIAPQALAVIYYNPDHKKTYLNVINLPQAPHGHQYQLWADVDGKHHNMGAVKVSNEEEQLHNLPFMENSKGFAITLEEVGKNIQPTVTKTCLSGTL